MMITHFVSVVIRTYVSEVDNILEYILGRSLLFRQYHLRYLSSGIFFHIFWSCVARNLYRFAADLLTIRTITESYER